MASSTPKASTSANSSGASVSLNGVQGFDFSESLALPSPNPSASLSIVQVSDSREPLTLGSISSSVPASRSREHRPLEEFQSSGFTASKQHANASESRNWWHLRRLHKKLGTEEQCLQFAEERGLLPRKKLCTYHKKPMPLTVSVDGLGVFRCCKTNCRTKAISRAKGTWFERARLSLLTLFEIMYMFSHNESYEAVQLETINDDTDVTLSIVTIADWYSYCRECVVVYELEHLSYNTMIGGTNKVVQIVESQFGKRKYDCGRHLEGYWVIGMIEDHNDDLILDVCPENEHSADFLVPLIKKHVQVGSTIHTDFGKAYDCLSEHGYIHKKVNLSDLTSEVVPDVTHTQSQWSILKRAFQDDQAKRDFAEWLIVNNWRRKIRLCQSDPFEELLTVIKYVFPLDSA